MKHKLALLSFLAFTPALWAQKECSFSFSAPGLNVDSMTVSEYNSASLRKVDRTYKVGKNAEGRFEFSVVGDSLRQIAFNITGQKINTAVIPAVPGERAVVTWTDDYYAIEGSQFYKDYGEYCLMGAADERALTRMVRDMGEASSEQKRDSMMNRAQEFYEECLTRQNENIDAFVVKHPDADASLYIMADLTPTEHQNRLMPGISERVRNGVVLPFLKLKQEEEARQLAIQQQSEAMQHGGIAAPDFTLTDITGKQLSLSSLRGRYVVIDFWGSWCIWCIRGIPQMKDYYAKYKDKVEFLGVDCRDTEQRWRAAVAEYQIPWLHVRNETPTDILPLYAIQGFPTKVIVDPQGMIVKTVIGEDPEFYQFLDQLLSDKE